MDNSDNVSFSHCNPWVSMLFHPETTVRYLLQTKSAGQALKMWLLFSVVWTAIVVTAMYAGGAFQNLESYLPIITLVIFLLGISLFYVNSYIYWKVSQWLGSTNERWQMQVMFVWTTVVPSYIFAGAGIILFAILGQWSGLLAIAKPVTSIWTIIISISGIREVSRLSILKSLLIYLSPVLFLAGIAMTVVVLLGSLSVITKIFH